MLLVLNLPSLSEVLNTHSKALPSFVGKDLSRHRSELEELADKHACPIPLVQYSLLDKKEHMPDILYNYPHPPKQFVLDEFF